MSLVITTPLSQIEKMVLYECVKVANKQFPSMVNGIKSDLINNIGYIFELSPEYKSIAYGDLQGHFGMRPDESVSKLKEIVTILAQSTQVDFVPFRVRGNAISGGLRIYAFKEDFSDILSSNAAYQTTNAGQQLPWLEWLLIEGDKVIIYDYFFLPGDFETSRSGQGIMVFDKTKYWRVPPQYSGTKNSNWITRTVNAYIDDIGLLIEKSIKKRL